MSLPRYDKRGAASLKPGFERINKLLALVGNPQRAYPIAHVAGTNGKGSTCSMLSAICTAAGLRVGLQTSPHVFDVTERMRIDGVPARAAWLDRTVRILRRPIEQIGPSFFEATTALSFLYFAENSVDLAVVEVGLGGRLDATNIVDPVVCGITAIGLDHTAILGNSLKAIAAEKAGIIKPGIPVFTSNTDLEVLQVLTATALNMGAPLRLTSKGFREVRVIDPELNTAVIESNRHQYGEIELDLKGQHQLENAKLAVAIGEALIGDKGESLVGYVRVGLEQTRRLSGLRGRLEVLFQNPTVIADVGHNVAGVTAALNYARAHCKGKLVVGVGLLRDKDYRNITRLIADAADAVQIIPLDGDRAIDPDLLRDEFKSIARKSSSLASPSSHSSGQPLLLDSNTASGVLQSFLTSAKPSDTLLLVGSHQVVSQLDQSLFIAGRSH